jgi:hypothetical protein
MSPLAPPRALRAPIVWGLGVGLLQAATPLVFWWLDYATVLRSDSWVVDWVVAAIIVAEIAAGMHFG